MSVWNESLHPRGAGGKFALHGAHHVEAGPGERPGQHRPAAGARAANAFRARPAESDAYWARRRVVGNAAQLRADHQAAVSGTATHRQRERVSYASPRKRDEAIARTGSPVMPLREALAREIPSLRGQEAGPRRVGTKTTFTGKQRAVRAYELPPGVSPIGKARKRMSAKPAPAAAAPKYTQSQLLLSTTTRLREIAGSLGVKPPPRAGSRQLMDLILRHQR